MNVLEKIQHLLNAIKGYERGDPHRNGEYKFIRSFLKDKMIIIDAGANIGYYTQYILNVQPNIQVHCFEPTTRAYTELIVKLAIPIEQGKVVCQKLGLSNEERKTEMFIYNDLDERNSLHFNQEHSFNLENIHKETIELMSLDKYTVRNGIQKIDLLKIDVEGHETKVIEGAAKLLQDRQIRCIQFEYNNNWAAAGFTLENIFILLSKFGYKFYRLAIWGKIPIRRFNKKLENYKHANYVAIISNING
jgi:FkbM family methyltransferase